MRFKIFKNTVLLFVLVAISCGKNLKIGDKMQMTNDTKNNNTSPKLSAGINLKENDSKSIVVGANRTALYLPLLQGKAIGVVANQTSLIFKEDFDKLSLTNGYTHLIDSLLSLNLNIRKVFAPEHGFRGTADAGEVVKDGLDTKTGLPIVSLYGKHKKPSPKQLEGLDIVVFDIQDVGARFYTYISSLHYVMEACAEQNITVLILDRPNPNGHYIDGPILEMEHKSFVGMHPVPIVHGMTIGEYAQMINGEGWLKHSVKCELKIIPIQHYDHKTSYSLRIKPSPNLPNDKAINLYPSLCFFEGTNISVGRGTEKQFQVVGSPFFSLKLHDFQFTPQPNKGAKYPKHEGKLCHGYDLHLDKRLSHLNLSWLIEFYMANKENAPNEKFFNAFFTKLAGTKILQQQIEASFSPLEIKLTWQNGLDSYDKMRKQYQLYK
jgi:uncharacterized protein YbbC (DUF1343 family)